MLELLGGYTFMSKPEGVLLDPLGLTSIQENVLYPRFTLHSLDNVFGGVGVSLLILSVSGGCRGGVPGFLWKHVRYV